MIEENTLVPGLLCSTDLNLCLTFGRITAKLLTFGQITKLRPYYM